MPELCIESLSHDGRGVARREGKVAFVGGALAGEVVEAELTRRHRRFDEYRLVNVLDASPERVSPPCPLIGRCGGCDLQHLSAAAQIRHKEGVLLDQLGRQAGMTPDELAAPLVCDPFGYRRRARLAVHLPRRGGRPLVGLRAEGDREVVPIDRCPVLVPELSILPGELQSLLGRLHRPGIIGHVELSLAETAGAVSLPVIYLRLVAELEAGDRALIGSFAAERQAFLALRVGESPLEYLHRPVAEEPAYRLPDFDLRITYAPGEFIQGNAGINRALVGRVVDWAGGPDGGSVLDAFSGVGNFALPLARRGWRVTGLEVSSESVARARQNATENGLEDVSFHVRELLGDGKPLEGLSFDVAVLDPPRTGARTLVEELAARRVASMVYVSCSPATLARDAAVLAAAGFTLEKICLVDMFPQTRHIEAVALFRSGRRRTRRGAQSSRGA